MEPNITPEQLQNILSKYPHIMDEINEVIVINQSPDENENEYEDNDDYEDDDYDDYNDDYDYEDDNYEREYIHKCVVTITSSRITIFVNGKSYAFNITEVPSSISSIIKKLIDKSDNSDQFMLSDDEVKALEQAHIPKLAKTISHATNGEIVIDVGNCVNTITLDGQPISHHNIDILMELAEAQNMNGIRQFVKFQRSLENNMSLRIIQRLYDFIKCTSIDIDDDGDIIAYKAINSDYYDCYTGKTFLNNPGAVIEMPRNKVDDNDNNTCSSGLHVCSINYLKNCFWSSSRRLAIVKIKPEDFVSIPTDYNDAKARVCKYTVVKVCDEDEAQKLLGVRFDMSDDDIEDNDDSYIDFSSLI